MILEFLRIVKKTQPSWKLSTPPAGLAHSHHVFPIFHEFPDDTSRVEEQASRQAGWKL